MRLRALLAELTRPQNTDEAGERLEQAGYAPIGSGLFSTVWARKGEPYVVKLFSARDTAYLAFVEMAQAQPNEHFPVFRGKPTRVSPTYWGVRVERLRRLSYKQLPLVYACKAYAGALGLLDHYRGQSGVTRIRGMDAALKVIRQFRQQSPSLAQALELLHALVVRVHPDAMVDIKPANLMLRGTTLVFVDPVGSGSTTDDPEVRLGESPTQEDLENIEHDKAVKRKPDMRKKHFVAMPGNTSTYPAL